MRIVLAITGASGAVYGYRLLQELSNAGVETHLVVSPWAEKTIEVELGEPVEKFHSLAVRHYEHGNMGAAISSGSIKTNGMIIAPCSMKTLAGIAHGYDENLVMRAASVSLKEHRKLLLLLREAPLTAIHLENMLKLARLGVTIMPPVPAFYNKPESIDDIVNHTVGRALDHFNIRHSISSRWDETLIKK